MKPARKNWMQWELFCAIAFALANVSTWGQSFQVWPEIDTSVSEGRLNLLVPAIVRVEANTPNPQFVATGALGTFSLNQHLSASPGYLFADLPQTPAVANVPIVALTTLLPSRRWTLADTNRFERLIS